MIIIINNDYQQQPLKWLRCMERISKKRAVYIMLSAICMGMALSLAGKIYMADQARYEAAALSPQEQLGHKLFEDTTLSEPKGVSCASCHDPRRAFQGNNGSPIAAVAKGSLPGSIGTRNVPTLMYMAFSPAFSIAEEKSPEGKVEYTPTGGQFWDGRADSLAQQAEGPLLNKTEMNNPSKEAVVQKVAASDYAPLMKQLYGDDIFAKSDEAFEKITEAISHFENTKRFAPFSSRFDDYLRGKATLSPIEAQGFALFKDPQKGNCIACHVGKTGSPNPQDWLFTDFTYDAVGVPRNASIPANHTSDVVDLGLCKQKGLQAKLPAELKLEKLCGAFKVPTLRNVAVTAPYMHNGYFKSLRDVVAFYATRDTNPERWYPKDANGSLQLFDDMPAEYIDNVNHDEAPYDKKAGETPRLSEAEIAALTAYLNTLTDNEMR